MLLQATAVALMLVAVGPAATASALPPLTHPEVAITSPHSGTSTNNQSPTFSGTTDNIFDEERLFFEQPTEAEDVEIKIYTTKGELVQEARTPNFLGGTWSVAPNGAIPPGTYTAVAEQADKLGGTGKSKPPVTFTVDITPPLLTLASPINGSSTSGSSQVVTGLSGTATGDSPSVSVHLFAGEAPLARANLETVETAPNANGSWSATFGGLGPGTYTVQAEQKDAAGNTGFSSPVHFTVNAPPTVPFALVASFKWFPPAPQAGEPVSLVSTSTDALSAITGFAWALTSPGAFTAGKPVLNTSFPTPGNHVVRLQVTDASGLSSTATETIAVAARALPLLLPVPIVRIAGSETSSGVILTVLAVQAPVTARVTVSCRGHGCPRKSVSVIARARKRSRARSVQIAFRRFERSLPAGVTLEIRVSKPGQIGKYTRFAIRRHTLPVRVDACLVSANPLPVACPS